MLFSLENHTTPSPQEAENNQPHAVRIKGENRFSIGVKKIPLDKLVGPIAQGESIHIPSMGNWSLADMIEYVISQIGPSKVHLTSWSVKNKAVVTLLRLRDQKQITSLNCLFDSRVPSTCPDAWQLVSANIENLKLTKIHAKVVALQSETHSVSIVSTANLTTNPRIERYVITVDENIYKMDRDWIQLAIEGGKPFT